MEEYRDTSNHFHECMGLNASRNAMQVLYSFCITFGNYRGAAWAMLALACRLREEAADLPGTLPAMLEALGAPLIGLGCTRFRVLGFRPRALPQTPAFPPFQTL